MYGAAIFGAPRAPTCEDFKPVPPIPVYNFSKSSPSRPSPVDSETRPARSSAGKPYTPTARPVNFSTGLAPPPWDRIDFN